jgi:hypothetical protein
MRLFWSVVLTGGLLFIGLNVYESQTDPNSGDVEMTGARCEDGTGYPSDPPPPPPR